MTNTVTTIDAVSKTVDELAAILAETVKPAGREGVDVILFDGTIANIQYFDASMGNPDGDDWYFVSGTLNPWIDSDNLTSIADELVNYEKFLIERNAQIRKLKAYKAKIDAEKNPYKKSEMLGLYSDWHKDIYGVRP